MDGPPNDPIDWRNFMAGDPYQPEDLPIPDLSEEEEDPSEDEIEDEEEYEPSEDPESDDESIPEDAQMDEDPKEIVTKPPSPPMPRYSRGKCPLLLRTPRMSIPPISRADIFNFAPLAIGVQRKRPLHEPAMLPEALRQRRNDDIPAHFETGESSQAPPRNIPIPPPAAPTIAQFNELVEQVRRLQEREQSNSEAIQTLYHRMGASRTEANNLRAHNQVLSYRLEITETRLDAAEHRAQEAEQERNLIRDEHDEIVRRFNDM